MEDDTQIGKTLVGGRYVIEQRLLSRPRLALYLARRQAERTLYTLKMTSERQSQGPLVAIRELVLSDFTPIIRSQVEAAAIEEFAHPTVFGSYRLSSAGDRIWHEHDRLYLALQLDEGQHDASSSYTSSAHRRGLKPIMLDRLLLDSPDWPVWLDERVAFEWGIQVCRIVARLHHQGVVLGNLNPCVLLIHEMSEAVQGQKQVIRTPLLLPCWPPAPCYWQGGSHKSHTYQLFAAHDYATAFPIGRREGDNAFIAPEMLYESRIEVTERADIYSLGALLYLLLTHFAPITAASRLTSEQHPSSPTFTTPPTGSLIRPPTYSIMTTPVPTQPRETRPRFERRRSLHHSRLLRAVTDPHSSHRAYNVFTNELEEVGLDLPDPRSLNANIPVQLADIVKRALELDASKRFESAFEMVEALEAIICV